MYVACICGSHIISVGGLALPLQAKSYPPNPALRALSQAIEGLKELHTQSSFCQWVESAADLLSLPGEEAVTQAPSSAFLLHDGCLSRRSGTIFVWGGVGDTFR